MLLSTRYLQMAAESLQRVLTLLKKVGSLVDCKSDGDDGRSVYFQFVPCCSGGCDGGVVVVMMMMIDRGNGLYFHLI